MTNPPEIPKDIIESYKKLSEAKQKRLEFMAAYPEYLLDTNGKMKFSFAFKGL